MVRSVVDNLVFFHYDKGSPAQRVFVDILKNYQGAIQTDGYHAYSIYEQKQGVLLLGCWAHVRRKFTEISSRRQSGAKLLGLRFFFTFTICGRPKAYTKNTV